MSLNWDSLSWEIWKNPVDKTSATRPTEKAPAKAQINQKICPKIGCYCIIIMLSGPVRFKIKKRDPKQSWMPPRIKVDKKMWTQERTRLSFWPADLECVFVYKQRSYSDPSSTPD